MNEKIGVTFSFLTHQTKNYSEEDRGNFSKNPSQMRGPKVREYETLDKDKSNLRAKGWVRKSLRERKNVRVCVCVVEFVDVWEWECERKGMRMCVNVREKQRECVWVRGSVCVREICCNWSTFLNHEAEIFSSSVALQVCQRFLSSKSHSASLSAFQLELISQVYSH